MPPDHGALGVPEFCANCGAATQLDDAFCTACGHRLLQSPRAGPASPPRGSRGRRLLLIAGVTAGAVVMGLAAGVTVLLTGSDDGPPAGADLTQEATAPAAQTPDSSPTPPPATSPPTAPALDTPTHVATEPPGGGEQLPRWDPVLQQCVGSEAWAEGMQVAVTPGDPLPGQVVEIGLRDMDADDDAFLVYTVTAYEPSGRITWAGDLLLGWEFAYLYYPDDFRGGQSTEPGVYTLVWEVSNLRRDFLACYGFLVE